MTNLDLQTHGFESTLLNLPGWFFNHMHVVLIFCSLLIACATLVVQSANAIYSVLYLILAFFNASALVLLCGHDTMAALFIVLYVGAMTTFFLFAIMILDIKLSHTSDALNQAPILNNAIVAAVFAFVCKNLNDQSLISPLENMHLNQANQPDLALGKILRGDSDLNLAASQLKSSELDFSTDLNHGGIQPSNWCSAQQTMPLSGDLLDATTQIYSLGGVLYTTYGWHLILASLILLSAMLGSIALTLNKTNTAKVQQIYEQNLRDFRLTLTKTT